MFLLTQHFYVIKYVFVPYNDQIICFPYILEESGVFIKTSDAAADYCIVHGR